MSITEPENHSLLGNFNLAKAYAPGIENNKVIKTVTIKAYAPGIENNKVIKTVTIDTRNEFIKKI